MLSSDSGSDDEQFVFIPQESIKDVLTIIHKGKPPKEAQPFAMGPNKKIYWPADLWNSGTLIYSIENPKVNLKPPVTRSDRILRFNSRFESGNLNLAYQLAPDVYHLILEYDKNKTGSCQWFYFQMTNVRKDIKYTFYISGFHKATSVDHGGLKIFWYSEKRANEKGISWSRGGYNYEYGVTLRDSTRKRASLQFKISFPYDNDTVYLCYALPYTYSELQKNILNWKKNHFSIFSSTTLCQTLGGRDCPLLTITSPRNIAENNKNYLFFTARVHPGESNGSFVIHGLIDFLLSDHPAAKYLVDKYVIKLVPMLNIDGVVEGYYRIGLSGVDLNRVWTTPNPTLHPVITATKNLVKELTKNGTVHVYIDFHGHSRLNGSFAYGCPNNISPSKDDIFLNCGKSLINTEKLLPRIISYLSDAFSWGSCQFSYPKERKAASRIVIRKELGIVQSFTIESSFGGIITGPRAGVLYDELIWKELGSKCGEGVYHMIYKKKSPLASYVEKEIKLITPNCCIITSEINDSDDAKNTQMDTGQIVDVDEINENENEKEKEKENDNENLNDNDNDNLNDNDNDNLNDNLASNVNSNHPEHHIHIKSTKKLKKKGTSKKKKAVTAHTEQKPTNLNDLNVNMNIMPIDEFSNLLNKIVQVNQTEPPSIPSLTSNDITEINKTLNLSFLSGSNNESSSASHSKKLKTKVTDKTDEHVMPDAPIILANPPPIPSAHKKVKSSSENREKSPKKLPEVASTKDESKEENLPHQKISKKSTEKKDSSPPHKTVKKAKLATHRSPSKSPTKRSSQKEDKVKNEGQIDAPDKKPESSKEIDDENNSTHNNHEDIELEYLNQRKAGKIGPSVIFRMMKPNNYLIANSKIITSQSTGNSLPKWSNIQFSKR